MCCVQKLERVWTPDSFEWAQQGSDGHYGQGNPMFLVRKRAPPKLRKSKKTCDSSVALDFFSFNAGARKGHCLSFILGPHILSDLI